MLSQKVSTVECDNTKRSRKEDLKAESSRLHVSDDLVKVSKINNVTLQVDSFSEELNDVKMEFFDLLTFDSLNAENQIAPTTPSQLDSLNDNEWDENHKCTSNQNHNLLLMSDHVYADSQLECGNKWIDTKILDYDRICSNKNCSKIIPGDSLLFKFDPLFENTSTSTRFSSATSLDSNYSDNNHNFETTQEHCPLIELDHMYEDTQLETDCNKCIDDNSRNYLKSICLNKNCNSKKLPRNSLLVKLDPLFVENTYSLDNNEKLNFSAFTAKQPPDRYETSISTSDCTDINILILVDSILSLSSSPDSNDRPTQSLILVDSQYEPGIAPELMPSVPENTATSLSPSLDLYNDSLMEIHIPTYGNFEHSLQDIANLKHLRISLLEIENNLVLLSQTNSELTSASEEMDNYHSRTIEYLDPNEKKLTEERDSQLDRCCKLEQQIAKKQLSYKQMITVMEEYEKTLSNLIKERIAQDQAEITEMERKKGQAYHNLSVQEDSFNAVHAKYEKCKAASIVMKKRDNLIQEHTSQLENALRLYDHLLPQLEANVKETLERADEELEHVRNPLEIIKLNAAVKKQKCTLNDLDLSVKIKSREIYRMRELCNELRQK